MIVAFVIAVSAYKFWIEISSFQLERVKVVEKEKDELEGAKNEAVQYLALENEITKLTNCLYQKYM